VADVVWVCVKAEVKKVWLARCEIEIRDKADVA